MTPLSNYRKRAEEILLAAKDEWIRQGRDPEHRYAIENFFTGVGLKLPDQLTAAARDCIDLERVMSARKAFEELQELDEGLQ